MLSLSEKMSTSHLHPFCYSRVCRPGSVAPGPTALHSPAQLRRLRRYPRTYQKTYKKMNEASNSQSIQNMKTIVQKNKKIIVHPIHQVSSTVKFTRHYKINTKSIKFTTLQVQVQRGYKSKSMLGGSIESNGGTCPCGFPFLPPLVHDELSHAFLPARPHEPPYLHASSSLSSHVPPQQKASTSPSFRHLISFPPYVGVNSKPTIPPHFCSTWLEQGLST